MFIFTIAKDPMKVIIMMASAFFWLLALLFSSALWAIVTPLKETLAFGLAFAVLFQELFRFVIYIILRKAEEGLQKVAVGEDKISIAANKHVLGYVAGLGFGVASGAFSLGERNAICGGMVIDYEKRTMIVDETEFFPLPHLFIPPIV